jgi:hypothetical protein
VYFGGKQGHGGRVCSQVPDNPSNPVLSTLLNVVWWGWRGVKKGRSFVFGGAGRKVKKQNF